MRIGSYSSIALLVLFNFQCLLAKTPEREVLFSLTFNYYDASTGSDTAQIDFLRGRSVEYTIFDFCQRISPMCTEYMVDTLIQAAQERAVAGNLVDDLKFGFPLYADTKVTDYWRSYRDGQSEVQIAHPACLRLTPKESTCASMNLLGNDTLGGAYAMCFDDGYWPRRPGSASCVVYTAGIYDDCSFEMDLVKLGCTVHSYDPNDIAEAHVASVLNSNNDPILSQRFHYHNSGVGERNFFEGKKTEKMSSIITNQYTRVPPEIAMLKIDIEGSEREVLTDLLEYQGGVLLDSIYQICLEWHWEPLYVGGSLHDLFLDMNRIMSGLTGSRHNYRMFYKDNRRKGHLLVTCFKKDDRV